MWARLWLLTPTALLYAGDIGLTLSGQPGVYWAGDYGAAVEANPVAYPLLVYSPWLFVVLAVVWLAILSALVVRWHHPLVGWAAAFVAAAHAVGGASWLMQIGPWGLAAAGVYIAVAAQASAWCWRRYAQQVGRDAESVAAVNGGT